MHGFIHRFLVPIFFVFILLDLNEFSARFTGIDAFLSNIILLIAIVILIFTRTKVHVQNRIYNNFLIALVIFITLGGYLLFLSSGFNAVYSEIRYYAPSFLIFLVAYRVATSSSSWKQFNRNVVLISALIALNGLLILISITLDIDFHGDETGEIDRAVGLYSNANRAGYVSCLGQASSLYMVMTRVRNRRYIFMGFYVICMVAALSTFSKGAATVTLFILSVFLFNSFSSPEMMRQKVVKRSINFLLLGLVLIAGYALLNINQIIAGFTAEQAQRSEELIQFYHGEINQATTTNRSELWQYALEQISDSPILGFGLGEFHVMDIGVGVHNIYLLLWGEAGILALLAYVIFLITWFKGSFKVREPSVRFYLRNVLLVVFLSGFAAHTLLVNKSYMIVLGVLIGGFAVDKHHIKLDRIKRYMQSKSESTQEE